MSAGQPPEIAPARRSPSRDAVERHGRGEEQPRRPLRLPDVDEARGADGGREAQRVRADVAAALPDRVAGPQQFRGDVDDGLLPLADLAQVRADDAVAEVRDGDAVAAARDGDLALDEDVVALAGREIAAVRRVDDGREDGEALAHCAQAQGQHLGAALFGCTFNNSWCERISEISRAVGACRR